MAAFEEAGPPAKHSILDNCFLEALFEIEQMPQSNFNRFLCDNGTDVRGNLLLLSSDHPIARHNQNIAQLKGCLSPKAAAALSSPYEPACPLTVEQISSLQGFSDAVQSPPCGECAERTGHAAVHL